MAHSSWYPELCPVHRGLIAMSGASAGSQRSYDSRVPQVWIFRPGKPQPPTRQCHPERLSSKSEEVEGSAFVFRSRIFERLRPPRRTQSTGNLRLFFNELRIRHTRFDNRRGALSPIETTNSAKELQDRAALMGTDPEAAGGVDGPMHSSSALETVSLGR